MNRRPAIAVLALTVTVCALHVSSAQARAPQPVHAPHLSAAQREALVVAYQTGYHYGIPLVWTAVVYVESSLCAHTRAQRGPSYGCAQIKPIAAKAVTGFDIPAWQLSNPDLRRENMGLGAAYLTRALRHWGYPAGIGAYHVGETRARELGRKALIALPYTRAVLEAEIWLRRLPQTED